MDNELLTIETPERVELHFATASLGTRFLACAIDHTVQVAVIVGLILLNEWLEISDWADAVVGLLVFLLSFGYFIIFEALWSGQTPGKYWLGLRVIQMDGRPLTFFAAMSRNILRLADMLFPPFYSIGLIAVFLSRHSRRLGDYVANTVVIRERAADAPTYESLFTGELIDAALDRQVPPVDFEGDIGAVTPAEILVVETFLRRRDQIRLSPRQWLAWRISTPLLEKIRPRFDPASFSYEGFLEELVARDRARTHHRAD